MAYDQKPAIGDGIKFGMTPEEMKLCGKYISDLFTATQNKALPVHKRMPAFFRTIGPEHIWDWIAMHRAEQAAAHREAAE